MSSSQNESAREGKRRLEEFLGDEQEEGGYRRQQGQQGQDSKRVKGGQDVPIVVDSAEKTPETAFSLAPRLIHRCVPTSIGSSAGSQVRTTTTSWLPEQERQALIAQTREHHRRLLFYLNSLLEHDDRTRQLPQAEQRTELAATYDMIMAELDEHYSSKVSVQFRMPRYESGGLTAQAMSEQIDAEYHLAVATTLGSQDDPKAMARRELENSWLRAAAVVYALLRPLWVGGVTDGGGVLIRELGPGERELVERMLVDCRNLHERDGWGSRVVTDHFSRLLVADIWRTTAGNDVGSKYLHIAACLDRAKELESRLDGRPAGQGNGHLGQPLRGALIDLLAHLVREWQGMLDRMFVNAPDVEMPGVTVDDLPRLEDL